MTKLLIEYLSQFTSLNEEEIKIIEEQSIIKECKKGEILLKEGQLSKESFLVLQGCVKSYYINKSGDEDITEFYTNNDLIIPVSYTNQKPSTYYLKCIEPCLLSTGNPERTNQFLKQFPKFATICMQINNRLLANKQISFDNYRNFPPETRYQKFIENRSELLNRIPQYMIASYLGIKPQSLSRIRKKLSQKS